MPDIRASSLQVNTAAGWNASAHSLTTMDYLKKRAHNFIVPHMWPPNRFYSPVDYAIWVLFINESTTNERQFKTVEELKRAIVTEWQKLSQRFIDNSINE